MSLEIIILAAGAGTRMHSRLPKVLHPLAGRPMLQHVLSAASHLAPSAVHLVVGHGHEQVIRAVEGMPGELRQGMQIHLQTERRGTAHAVLQAVPALKAESLVLVLYGDTPLIQDQDLRPLINALQQPGTALALLSADLADPSGYGRIVRDAQGRLIRISEHRDATPQELAIHEVNTGMLCTSSATLCSYLPRLRADNAQREYYLTDLAGLLAAEGHPVQVIPAPVPGNTSGINDCAQLAAAERYLQLRQAQELLARGVTLADPQRFDLRGTLETGSDVFIDINVIISGAVRLGDGVRIGAGCLISDAEISAGAVIAPYSIIEGSQLGPQVTVGPFARLRPGSLLEEQVHIGNFVEVKNSHLGSATKAGHLSYLGDSTVGREVNIGAGTITCNYDGAHKHRTIIGDHVFIGSDTQLVAPVEIKDDVTIGAGTTVTRSLRHAPGDLLITRATPRVYADFARPGRHPK